MTFSAAISNGFYCGVLLMGAIFGVCLVAAIIAVVATGSLAFLEALIAQIEAVAEAKNKAAAQAREQVEAQARAEERAARMREAASNIGREQDGWPEP